jgi:CheY-like chemotaxis protein
MVGVPLVIVVEPVPVMQEILKAALEEEFLCRVKVQDGVTKLREAVIEDKPALIVLDIETAGAQRFLMDLKDDPNTCTIPVIGASLSEQKSCRVAVAAGYDDCFQENLLQLESLAWKYLPARPIHQNLTM